MKRMLTTILMAVGITGPFVTHLAAQRNRTVADIPFAFVADNLTLPAGEYEVSQRTSGGSFIDALKVFLELTARKAA
jgi:hypothetical protein